MKTIRLSLTAQEWRKLRAWAAEEDTSVRAILAAIVRRELSSKPRRSF